MSTTSPGGVMAISPVTLNGVGEVAEPSGVVMVIGPVVAPGGTFVTS